MTIRYLYKKIFNSTEFLEDPNWTIEPKDIKPLPVKSGRNLLLFYFGKNFGTPVMKLTGKTDFNEGVTQQYFRVYEVLNKNLVNVTQEFFYPNEEKTLSLDNSGYVYFLDVDGDGLIDIFPQLGSTPYPVLGGISQFLKYPSWNGKFNTMYYFKQENTGKFKLTDLIKIDKLNFPQNFKESEFRLFNDYGEYKNSSGNTLRCEAFTMLNQFSLNDIDNDGKFEYLTSWQPDFLSLYTKSKINYSPVSNYNINDSQFIFANDPVNAWQEYYDYSKIKISKDTAFANLDYAVSQKFIVKDSLKLLTNSPFTYSPQLSNSIYSIDPPKLWNYTKVSDTIHLMGCVVPSNLVDSVGVDFMVPIGLPTNNDVYIKQSKLTYIKKNFAPFPFDVLKEVRLDNSNFRGFEVTISNSVDINLNEYKINDIIYRGPRYGYELFINNVKVKTALLSNNDFSFERINNLTVRKFRIPLEQKSFLNVRYKVFAIDTHNENLKTFAINRICDNSLLPTLKYTKNSFCESDSIKIQISNASSSDRYKWYVGSKIDSSNVLSKYITSTNKIFVIKTDSLDCVTSSDTVSITKLAAVPVPKISNSGSLTFCAGQNVVLTSSETNNLWYLNGNEISNSNSKTLTVTSAGAYSVKSILGECSSQLSSTVTVTVNSIPDTPKITNSTPLTFCTGQSVILTSSGSNNQWYLNTAAISNATSTTLTVTASGSYAVKSTISGCSSPLSSAVNVVVNTIPEVPKITNSTPLTFCAGQNVQLTSSGTNNQWYLNGSAIANETSATYIATASGTYTVKAINANCSSPLSTGSVVVVNPIPPTPTITLEANGGLTSSAADGIQWYFNDVKIDNATQKTINPTKSGNYTVKVLTPCASEISKPFNLVVTGTEEAILEQVQLSPNPFLSQFKVSFPIEFGKTAQVKIVDMSGNVQFNKASVIDGEQIDLAKLNHGNYILHLTSNDNMNSKAIKISKIQ